MRQVTLLPCNCDMCYFCINGLTNGIAHPSPKKRKVEIITANHVRVKTDKCTTERIKLKDYADYCKMCYRKNIKRLKSENSSVDARTIQKKLCNKSSMGCAQCKELICKSCWEDGYDKHEKDSIEMSDD